MRFSRLFRFFTRTNRKKIEKKLSKCRFELVKGVYSVESGGISYLGLD